MSTVSIRYIVHDVDAAIDFYTTYLQFELQMHPNNLFAMLGHGDLRLVLVKPTGPQGPAGGGAAMPDGRMQEPGGWNRFSVEVPDLAATVTELRSRGARFRNDIVTGTGGEQIIIEDPSGNPRRTLPADPSRGQDDPADGMTTGGAVWNRPGRRRTGEGVAVSGSPGPGRA